MAGAWDFVLKLMEISQRNFRQVMLHQFQNSFRTVYTANMTSGFLTVVTSNRCVDLQEMDPQT